MKRRRFLKKYAGLNASLLFLPYSNNLNGNYAKDRISPSPESIDDFPKTTIDKDGNIWSIYINRKGLDAQINLSTIKNNGENSVVTFNPENNSGIAQPAIASLENGCVVAFPVEQGNKIKEWFRC